MGAGPPQGRDSVHGPRAGGGGVPASAPGPEPAVCRVQRCRRRVGGGHAAEIAAPVPAQPMHHLDDRVDVLLLFFLRVGVIESQVADAAEIARQAEVQADALGMADVQVAVGLGRKAQPHRRWVGRTLGVMRCIAWRAAPLPLRIDPVLQFALDQRAQEVGGFDGRVGLGGRGHVLGGRSRGVEGGGSGGLSILPRGLVQTRLPALDCTDQGRSPPSRRFSASISWSSMRRVKPSPFSLSKTTMPWIVRPRPQPQSGKASP